MLGRKVKLKMLRRGLTRTDRQPDYTRLISQETSVSCLRARLLADERPARRSRTGRACSMWSRLCGAASLFQPRFTNLFFAPEGTTANLPRPVCVVGRVDALPAERPATRRPDQGEPREPARPSPCSAQARRRRVKTRLYSLYGPSTSKLARCPPRFFAARQAASLSSREAVAARRCPVRPGPLGAVNRSQPEDHVPDNAPSRRPYQKASARTARAQGHVFTAQPCERDGRRLRGGKTRSAPPHKCFGTATTRTAANELIPRARVARRPRGCRRAEWTKAKLAALAARPTPSDHSFAVTGTRARRTAGSVLCPSGRTAFYASSRSGPPANTRDGDQPEDKLGRLMTERPRTVRLRSAGSGGMPDGDRPTLTFE